MGGDERLDEPQAVESGRELAVAAALSRRRRGSLLVLLPEEEAVASADDDRRRRGAVAREELGAGGHGDGGGGRYGGGDPPHHGRQIRSPLSSASGKLGLAGREKGRCERWQRLAETLRCQAGTVPSGVG